jgi:hypothetical protein
MIGLILLLIVLLLVIFFVGFWKSLIAIIIIAGIFTIVSWLLNKIFSKNEPQQLRIN